jgi:bacteriorhodopsin
MAIGDGVSYSKTTITHSNKHVPDTHQTVYREVYWARYVDWSLTTPLLLMDLAFLAGLSGANILVAVVADVIMILTGLFAAFGHNESAKWGYYTIACIAYLVVIYQLAVHGRATVKNKDAKTATFFQAIAGFTLVLWTVYPMYVCELGFPAGLC